MKIEMNGKKLKLLNDLMICLSALEDQASIDIEDNPEEYQMWHDMWLNIKTKLENEELG